MTPSTRPNAHRPLGSTGLRISSVGIGCWQLGGDGWGAVSARDVQAAIGRAIELGLNVFDTAPVYGFGQSEELLGRTLAEHSGDPVVVSKAGLVWDDQKRVRHDNRPESLRAQLEGSLRRLGREPLDALLLHWPDPAVPLDDCVPALDSFRREGKIRAWGLSNFPAPEVLRLRRPDVFLEYPWNALGAHASEARAAATAARELLDRAGAEGPGFVAYDVLARGLLGGRHGAGTRFGKRDVRSRDERFSARSFQGHLQRASRLCELASEIGAPPAALAMRAALDCAGVTCALAGVKTSAQVEEIARAPEIQLTDDVRAALRSLATGSPAT